MIPLAVGTSSGTAHNPYALRCALGLGGGYQQSVNLAFSGMIVRSGPSKVATRDSRTLDEFKPCLASNHAARTRGSLKKNRS